ncbi:hypothetical protein KR009_009995 [Drosophila setifemur]|nr:hypothetical protein KR009_009995 [Drosophila setifemur]
MNLSRFGLVLSAAVIILTISVFGDENSYFTEYSQSQKKTIAIIQHIRVFGESRYMKAKYFIHKDRAHFDLNVKLNRELASNHLIMNVKIRVKPDGGSEFVQLFDVRKMNFCGFLVEYNTNPMLQFLFKKTIVMSDVILCPVRVGNYSMMNTDVAGNISPDGVQNGTYKFFAEIVEENGEIAKVFALQVTSAVSIIEAPSSDIVIK